jgi:indole-3-glycerol phosphate synthase
VSRVVDPAGSVLADILDGVRADLAARQVQVPLEDLKAAARRQRPALDPLPSFAAPGVSVIAEVKRSSPSRGSIAEISDPAALARQYADGGAAAISVLTEQRRFGGSLADLRAVRDEVDIPVLRKDFVLSSYQLWEARAHGADLVLLMVVCLEQPALVSLVERAQSIGLTPLVEVHDAVEVERAVAAGATLIGVNNRDLRTLKVDRGTFTRLAPLIPRHVVRVAESGIRGPADVIDCAAAGADAVLVGTSLVSDSRGDVSAAVADLVAAGAHPALARTVHDTPGEPPTGGWRP